MDRVDLYFPGFVYLVEKRVFSGTYPIYHLIPTLRLEMVYLLFDILFQGTAVCDIEHLHAFTDPEDGLSSLEYSSHRSEKIAIVFRDDTSCSISRVTIEARVDIGSSWEYIGIAHVEIALEIHRKCGDDDGETTSLLDRTDIVEGKVIEEPPCVFSSLCEDADRASHKKRQK